MICLNCGNCKQGDAAYFCFEKNEFIVNEEISNQTEEKQRGVEERGS